MPGAVVCGAWSVISVAYDVAGEFIVGPFPRAANEVEADAVLEARGANTGIRILVELHGSD